MARSSVKSSSPKGGGTKTQKFSIVGTELADSIYGTERNDTIDARGGNDSIFAGGGNDFIVGGEGDDVIDGGTGYDHMDGGAGNDTYVVDNGSDLIVERIEGGTDTVVTFINYQLFHSELENLILAGGTAVTGFGNYRDNRITGNGIGNRLEGKEGNDVIDGKYGGDVLVGGLGADTFVFSTAPGAANVDQILDFQPGVDRIALDDAAFAGLTPGALAAEAFAVGTAAADADDRILYDPATGALRFDADGVGGVEAVVFATVQPGAALTVSDFAVI